MFAIIGRTKLVDPDVTSAFELGSSNGFAPQQRIPDQLDIWLGVDQSEEPLFILLRSRIRGCDTASSWARLNAER